MQNQNRINENDLALLVVFVAFMLAAWLLVGFAIGVIPGDIVLIIAGLLCPPLGLFIAVRWINHRDDSRTAKLPSDAP